MTTTATIPQPTTPTSAIELRAIRPLESGKNETLIGYYNDPPILAAYAKDLNTAGFHIYSPINPIRQTDAILARLNQAPTFSGATSDADVERRLVLPYDIDAERAIDDQATEVARANATTKANEKMDAARTAAAIATNDDERKKAVKAIAAAERLIEELTTKPKEVRYKAANEEERQTARGMAKRIISFWQKLGVEPKILDSGNGYQLFVPIELPNDADSKKLIRDVLTAHKTEFEMPGAKLDCWDDAARILRLPGYYNVKGDNSDPLRPHRIVKQFKQLEGRVATREMLEEIVRHKTPASTKAIEVTEERGPFTYENVEEMLEGISENKAEFSFEKGKTSQGPGWFVTCPNESEHTSASGAAAEGGLSSTTAIWLQRGFAEFRCQHEHCHDIRWKRFVELTGSADLQKKITQPWLTNGVHGTGASIETLLDGAETVVEVSPFFSDKAIAKRFAQLARESVSFLRDREIWIRYANGLWRDDTANGLSVRHAVSEYLSQQSAEVDAYFPMSDVAAEAQRIARARSSTKNELASARKEGNVKSIVQHQPCISKSADQFDKEPFLLGCPKGQVVDLRTGTPRPAVATDFLTKRVSCLPEGTCPRFEQFMFEIMGGNQEMVGYLRRTCGYLLTGSTREEALIVWQGPGGGGKSSLVNTLQHILRDYATTIPIDTLTIKKSGEMDLHNIARLCGARVGIAHEGDNIRKFDAGLLKVLTGGDQLVGEKKFEHPFSFSPTHKLVVLTNHKPIIEIDGGIKRRLQLVPFQQRYTTDESVADRKKPDLGLKEKLIEEAPGVLSWMIAGALEWQKRGLDPPKEVLDYTTEYFEAQDTINEWIEQACEKDPNATTSNDSLFQSWKAFCSTRGDSAVDRTSFIEKLRQKSFGECRIREKDGGQIRQVRGTKGLRKSGSFVVPVTDEMARVSA